MDIFGKRRRTSAKSISLTLGRGEGHARELYSYFAGEDEVKELVRNVGWEIMDMGEDDKRGTNDYITHSWMYMFATRTKE